MDIQIIKLETNQDRMVITAHFTVSDQGKQRYAKVQLPEPDQESFIPYDDLTEGVVIGWIEGTDEYDRAVSLLEADIAKEQQVVAPPLPWSQTEE